MDPNIAHYHVDKFNGDDNNNGAERHTALRSADQAARKWRIEDAMRQTQFKLTVKQDDGSWVTI